MIEHYTIKIAPAVSQKELIKRLEGAKETHDLHNLHQFKVRVEMICDAEDYTKLVALLKELQKPKE